MQPMALCCASVHTRILNVGTVLTHKVGGSTTEKGHQLVLILKLQEYRIQGVSALTHFGSFLFFFHFPHNDFSLLFKEFPQSPAPLQIILQSDCSTVFYPAAVGVLATLSAIQKAHS